MCALRWKRLRLKSVAESERVEWRGGAVLGGEGRWRGGGAVLGGEGRWRGGGGGGASSKHS